MASRNTSPPPHRPRTVTLTATLLLAEWFGFLALGILHITAAQDALNLTPQAIRILRLLHIRQAHAGLMGVLFLLLALTSLAASLGFFRVFYPSRLIATTTQGIALLIAITLYFSHEPVFAYFVMAYCAIIVSYLNYPDVRDAFDSHEPDICERVAK